MSDNIFTEILATCKTILESIKSTSFKRGGEFSALDGQYHCDCSSYINSILSIIDKNLYLKLLGQRSRLKAIDYFELAKSNDSLIKHHSDIQKLQAGEVLVWKKENPPKSGDTGHMLVVLKKPEKIDEGRWKILVSDCTKISHDRDSREDTSKGVGRGEMILLTENSKINGYIWSTSIPKNKITEVLCMSFSNNTLE
jgi:hypothetical protein